MMFKVIFWKTILNGDNWDLSTKFATFQRIEDLPFAPSPLIQFSWPLGLLPEAPVSVSWNSLDQQFTCTMPEEFPHIFQNCTYDYQWLVEHAKQCGWKLIKETEIS